MRPLHSLAALSLLTVPAGLAAQGGPASSAEDLAGGTPSGRTESLLNGVVFDLSVSEEESVASAQIGETRTRLAAEGLDASQDGWSWSLKFSVPVGGHDDLTAGATFDALAGGPKVTANLNFFEFRGAGANFYGPGSRFNQIIMADARRRCAAAAAIRDGISAQERDAAVSYCNGALPDPEFAAEHSRFSDAAINRSLYKNLWQAGIEATLGLERFEYIDAATLTELDRTEPQFSVAAYGGYYPSDGVSAVLARAEYQNGYEAADAEVVCLPVVDDPDEDCAHGAPTAPSNVEHLNFSLEYRRILDSGWSVGSFAISPRGTIDALSGEYAIDFPLYFIPRGDWPIAPGIRVSYSSEEDDVLFGVFLRWSFSLGS